MYTSEENGIVEQKYRRIVELGLTHMSQASMPLYYWSDVVFTAVFLVYRLLTCMLSYQSSHENVFNKQHD